MANASGRVGELRSVLRSSPNSSENPPASSDDPTSQDCGEGDIDPVKVSFRCQCGSELAFSALDRTGECHRIVCHRCDRLWEQRLLEDDGGRGWIKTLSKPPRAGTPGPT